MSKKVTYSTGFDKSKLYTYVSLYRLMRKDNIEIALHDYQNTFCAARQVIDEYINKDLEDVRMLEVGCGQRFAVSLLFHTIGTKVTGIDTDFVESRFTPRGFISVCKHNGFERAAKTLLRHILFDGTYYKTLENELGEPLKKDEYLDIRMMSACELDFADNEFDYAYSNAVFEHINDVDKACSEVHRVLKQDGVFDVLVHLYPSISGGHNLEWGNPDKAPSTRVPPWDHLRQNLYPTHVYLNKLHEKDLLSIFNNHFTVLDVKSKYEGEYYLTDDISTELSGYTREELLKRYIRVIMRK